MSDTKPRQVTLVMEDTFIFRLENPAHEVLRFTANEFYVRGVKVDTGPGEAKAVFDAFKQWVFGVQASREAAASTKH